MSKYIFTLICFVLLGVAGSTVFIDGLGAISEETHEGVRAFLGFYAVFGMVVAISGFSLAIDTAMRLHNIPTRSNHHDLP